MSFAVIHRDLEREWENQGGVMGIFLNNWRPWSLPEDLYICENSGEDVEIKFVFEFNIALEHLGANEQWSLWSMAHRGIALLVCFIVLVFLYFRYS